MALAITGLLFGLLCSAIFGYTSVRYVIRFGRAHRERLELLFTAACAGLAAIAGGFIIALALHHIIFIGGHL